jgi:hypothetical protein
MKHWEIIADNLGKAGWDWGCVSAIDSNRRTIWVADTHRDDGKRFSVSHVRIRARERTRHEGRTLDFESTDAMNGAPRRDFHDPRRQVLSLVLLHVGGQWRISEDVL